MTDSEDLSKLTESQIFARLTLIAPHRSPDDWRRALNLPEPFRTQTLQAWLDSGDDWTQNPDHFANVVALVNALVQGVSALGSVAGAVASIVALKAL
jgi:hypothetical protein